MGSIEVGVVEGLHTVPICTTCKGEQVAMTALACWNPETGLWELEAVLEGAFCHTCNGATTLSWKSADHHHKASIRSLNDRFRADGIGNGTVLITAGVQGEGQPFVVAAMHAVRTFTDFTKDNDPWHEHDFGAVDIDDQKVFWKIDYYDLSMTAASPNPANEAATSRVLTIMLASEY